MATFLFLVGTLFFGVTSVILAIVLWEAYAPGRALAVRKWRYAFSKRKEIQAALEAERSANEARSVAENKMRRAREQASQASADAKTAIAEMGSYIIAEQSSEHLKSIRANNYHAKEKKILRSIEKAKEHGYDLPSDERKQLARMLKQAHEAAIRAEAEKQRQAEIKAQIREEEKRQREIDRAIKAAEKEAKLKERALQEAIKLLGNTHSEQLEKLRAELAEAQANAERTKSMAQQTKAGHIYIISNIGSFGRDTFKVGMTRRLEPLDRVRELSDASVPFNFDVHAMISADDAPALEAALHRELEPYRVNKVNRRKEFFRVDIGAIISAVQTHHGEVEYEADPEALEYLESLEPQETWSGD